MPDLDLTHIKRFSPEATSFMEAGLRYIHLPKLKLPEECTPDVDDALMCIDQREGYPTRLFFSKPITTKARPLNWHMTVTVAGTVWHAFSWNYVQSTTPVEILVGHLRAFLP